jgi:ATP-dependent Lon protease
MTSSTNLLLPVLPLRELCLFPEASLGIVVSRAAAVRALEIAERSGRRVLALAQRDPQAPMPGAKELYAIGTLAEIKDSIGIEEGGRRLELDGLHRAQVVSLVGADALVAEAEPLDEGDPGDEWGAAVEALARYLHAHPVLRSFLDQQRRSKEPMAWVNLACQHLPIAATARQRLLESSAADRCQKIGRGLDALLRKEKGD